VEQFTAVFVVQLLNALAGNIIWVIDKMDEESILVFLGGRRIQWCSLGAFPIGIGTGFDD